MSVATLDFLRLVVVPLFFFIPTWILLWAFLKSIPIPAAPKKDEEEQQEMADQMESIIRAVSNLQGDVFVLTDRVDKIRGDIDALRKNVFGG